MKKILTIMFVLSFSVPAFAYSYDTNNNYESTDNKLSNWHYQQQQYYQQQQQQQQLEQIRREQAQINYNIRQQRSDSQYRQLNRPMFNK